MDIQEELKKLPDQPGVYIMRDASDDIIYIGKAKSLTKRVHQYFQESHDEGIKKKQMVEHIHHFEYIVTDSELEALVLECNLIKEHRPKYNTLLRDDKTYPYIKVTMEEAYPRVVFSRQMKKDNNLYFGPFTSAGAVRDTIELVEKLFQLRNCRKLFPRDFGKGRPCLNYHMGQCLGVCTGKVSEEEYGEHIKAAVEFLSGNDRPVVQSLTEKMQEASENMEFERAAGYRDLLQSVAACMQQQKITYTDGEDKDVIGMAADEEDAVFSVFFIRDGRMIGRDHFHMNVRVEDQETSLLERFLQQYYSGTPFFPKEIFLPAEPGNLDTLEMWLKQRAGAAVHLRIPKRGQKERLVELANKNSAMVLSKDREKIKREEGRTIGAVKEISELLELPYLKRMEAYDISNTSGYLSVGSMVVFENGKPKRSDYRKFRLKTVEGPNDYASMREVLTRRFTHSKRRAEARAEDMDASLEAEMPDVSHKSTDVTADSFDRLPDVIMMDGGRGQVNIALEVLSELGLSIPVCGMVKDDHHRTRGLYFNNVELPIDRSSEGFRMITRLQDEAHRFAITYHKSLRGKSQVKSFLDDIKGIGPARRKALMREFENVDAMRQASLEDFLNIPEMNREASEALYSYFHS